MITIFAAPKPFQGHSNIIQRNAIQSWLLLQPKCEIILFGDEPGIAEVAAEFGIRHVANVVCNEYGTPLISDVFAQAQQLAKHEILCYVNADIILLDDFSEAVKQMIGKLRRFLLSGRRWNIEVSEAINFNENWQTGLKNKVNQQGKLALPNAMDYFVFRRNEFIDFLPFVVGRPGWDNWLIYRTRGAGIALVDATQVILAIHQNHNYNHVPNRIGQGWEGPEAAYNRSLIKEDRFFLTIANANWLLTARGLFPAITLQHLCQIPYIYIICNPQFFQVVRVFYRIFKALGKQLQLIFRY